MAKIKVRYLTTRPGRDGDRHFWQPSSALRGLGWHMERLPDDLMLAVQRAEALNAQLDAWRRGEAVPEGTAGAAKKVIELQKPGTVNALIASYKASPRYPAKAKTRQGYDYALRVIADWAGEAPLAAITPKRIQKFYQSLQPGTPAKANAVLRQIHILFEHARREDMVKVNPAADPGMISTVPRIRVWSFDELDAVTAHADALGLSSIGDAVLIGHQLGQRQGDILALSWLRYQDGAFLIRQKKTGALVKVPTSPRLAARLEVARQRQHAKGHETIIVCQESSGRRYRGDNFTHLFARVRTAAAGQPQSAEDAAATGHLTKVSSLLGIPAAGDEPEIPTAWYMDLRDTAVTNMGEAGCTVPEIASITGHTPESVYRILKHYLALTSHMASAAIAKLVAHEEQQREKRKQHMKEA